MAPALPGDRVHCFAHGSGSISFNKKGDFFQDKVSQGYRRPGVKNSYSFQEIDGASSVYLPLRSSPFFAPVFLKEHGYFLV